MRKILKVLCVSMAIGIGITNVSADCSYTEKAALNREVANIKVRYETAQGQMDPKEYICSEYDPEDMESCAPTYDYLNMNILNMNEKFYIVVTDEVDRIKKTYYYDDVNENGVITFPWEKLNYINKFTYTIYSSDATNCPNERLRVIYQTTPKRNLNANLEICNEVPGYYLCDKFVTYEKEVGFEEFMDKVEQEIESRKKEEKKKNKSFWEKIWDFIKDNKVVVIACTAVIIVSAAGTIIVIRKRREIK